MLQPGLVSITFRSLAPEKIIQLAVEGGLQAIEWGGDVHVPAGEIDWAREVGRRTREAGLMVSAYGSYYRLGVAGDEAGSFKHVLASATALAAPTIRVWAGDKGSAACSSQERRAILDDALGVADMAAQSGITISLECHGGTLTDTRDSIRSLLEELVHPNIEFLWQPLEGESVEAGTERLLDLLPRLRNVHVFHWGPSWRDRHPLAEGAGPWRVYIDLVRAAGRPVDFLLELVADDSPSQFLADAATLRRFLQDA